MSIGWTASPTRLGWQSGTSWLNCWCWCCLSSDHAPVGGTFKPVATTWRMMKHSLFSVSTLPAFLDCHPRTGTDSPHCKPGLSLLKMASLTSHWPSLHSSILSAGFHCRILPQLPSCSSLLIHLLHLFPNCSYVWLLPSAHTSIYFDSLSWYCLSQSQTLFIFILIWILICHPIF